MSRKITFATNSLKHSLEFLKKQKPNPFVSTLKMLGVNKTVCERSYKLGLYKLGDIEQNLNSLLLLYNNDGSKLITLDRNIRNICKTYSACPRTNNIKKVHIARTNSNVKKAPDKKTLLRNIGFKSKNCCVCCTLGELVSIGEDNFIGLMKEQFAKIDNHKLKASRVRSWRDEYKQIVHIMIPILKKHNDKVLNFHIVFELKLPKLLTNLDSREYVYADSLIIGEKKHCCI